MYWEENTRFIISRKFIYFPTRNKSYCKVFLHSNWAWKAFQFKFCKEQFAVEAVQSSSEILLNWKRMEVVSLLRRNLVFDNYITTWWRSLIKMLYEVLRKVLNKHTHCLVLNYPLLSASKQRISLRSTTYNTHTTSYLEKIVPKLIPSGNESGVSKELTVRLPRSSIYANKSYVNL